LRRKAHGLYASRGFLTRSFAEYNSMSLKGSAPWIGAALVAIAKWDSNSPLDTLSHKTHTSALYTKESSKKELYCVCIKWQRPLDSLCKRNKKETRMDRKLVCSPDDCRYNIYEGKELFVSLQRLVGTISQLAQEPTDKVYEVYLLTEDYGMIFFKASRAEGLEVGMVVALYFIKGKPVTEYNYDKRT